MYMTRDVHSVSTETKMSKAIQIMMQKKVRRLVVTDVANHVIGIICQRDIFVHFPEHANPFSIDGIDALVDDMPVSSLMSGNVISINSKDPIEVAAKKMSDYRIGVLPVLHKNKLVGIITESDLFRAFVKILAIEGKNVRITFDLDGQEDILMFLIQLCQKHELTLISFLRYRDKAINQGVVNVCSHPKGSIDNFVDELWRSGHTVSNILRGHSE